MWVTSGEYITLDRREGRVILIIWVLTLQSWAIISQVGIENSKVPIVLRISSSSIKRSDASLSKIIVSLSRLTGATVEVALLA